MLNPERKIFMRDVSLFPQGEEKIVWKFKKDEYDDLHFVQLPKAWRIDISENEIEFGCAGKELHYCVSFLFELFESTRDLKEWKKLNVMIILLRKEFNDSCVLCEQKNRIDPLYHCFLVGLFLKNHDAYIERHCHYAKKILSQTRKKIGCDLMILIRDAFNKVRDLELDIKDKSILFKRFIMEDLRKVISFVHVREIDFNEWLNCLLYLYKMQMSNLQADGISFQSLMKKMWILLNLYFTEARIDSHNIDLYEEDTPIELDDQEDLLQLKNSHPLLRGSMLI